MAADGWRRPRSPAAPTRPGGDRRSSPPGWMVVVEYVVQLPAAGDAELAVGPAQVGFDRLRGDEDCLCDGGVVVAVQGQEGDALFGGGEGVDAGDGRAPG